MHSDDTMHPIPPFKMYSNNDDSKLMNPYYIHFIYIMVAIASKKEI